MRIEAGPGADAREANLTTALGRALPLGALNAGAGAVERVVGRPLFGLRRAEALCDLYKQRPARTIQIYAVRLACCCCVFIELCRRMRRLVICPGAQEETEQRHCVRMIVHLALALQECLHAADAHGGIMQAVSFLMIISAHRV